jgi:hypothetical protein
MSVRSVLPPALFLVLFALPTPTWAGDDKVRVSVVVILATDRDDKIHPKLECIAREVKKRYPKFTGFQLADTSCKSVVVGTSETFKLACGKVINILVEHTADKDDRIQLKVTPPSMSEITYSTPCGKYLPIMTSVRTKNNEMVIICVCVQPCKGKCGMGKLVPALWSNAIPPAGAVPYHDRHPAHLPLLHHRPATALAHQDP